MIPYFPGKRADEQVIMIIRKHPIVYLRLLFIFLVITGLPMGAFLYFWFTQYSLSTESFIGIVGYIGVCFFGMFSLAVFLITWINEAFDIFILTNQRLMDITQVNLFKRTVTETQLRNIEDTMSRVSGILPTLLNYGDVDVQTASGDPTEFYMDHVHDPSGTARVILNAVYEAQKRHSEAIAKGLEYPDKGEEKGKAI